MPAPVVTFEVPSNIKKPGVYIEARPNYSRRGPLPFDPRPLLIVQKLAAGTAAALQRYKITDDFAASVLFGPGSIGADMVRAFRRSNRISDLTVMAMDDVGAGTVATGTLTFTGAPTANGTLPIYIEGQRVAVTIATSMTLTQVAAAVVAAVNANTSLPVTAANAAGVVTFTSKHKGASQNDLDIRVGYFADDLVPAGLTIAPVFGVPVTMSGGATNPDIATALNAIAAEWYTDIAAPWSDAANITALTADLALRFRAMGKRDGHGYLGMRGAYGALISASAAWNSPFLTVNGKNRPLSSPWELAASDCAVACLLLANDPARQLQGGENVGILLDPATEFTDQEKDLLIKAGIATHRRNVDGKVLIDRMVTTYKTSALGAPDNAWDDIMVAKTVSRIRWDWVNFIALQYPNHKMTDDDSVAANNSDAIVTPRRLHGTWAARCALYEEQGWIQHVEDTVRASSFQISATDKDQMEANLQINVIGNMITMRGALEFWV